MQKALQQAILMETAHKNDKNSKPKPKKDTKTITSGDIFSARTLESRFVLSHYDQRTTNPNTVLSVHRNQLRRGRSPFPKKHKHKYSQRHNKNKIKLHHNKTGKLLRYQKRKPFYLLQEKTKQRNSGWLNTHLWHAKRCKMGSLWRYKLPLRNLQHASKSFKSTITQLTTCCTLHDASYWNIIALKGKQSHIVQLLLPFIAPFQRGSEVFTQKETLHGYRECQLYIYRKQCYPFQFLCTVRCSWNAVDVAQTADDTQQRVCWIWCHASVYKALFRLLQPLVDKQNDVEIRNESRQFVRYELRGPMSSFVLQSASGCCVPALIEGNSEELVADGSMLCSTLICDPKHYSVAQPFVLNKKIKNKTKSLQFQLKDAFVARHTPSQHPLILLHQYKDNNYRLKDRFYTYGDRIEDIEMESKEESKTKKIRNPLFEFPFMMIARRCYDSKDTQRIRNRITGWDVVIPIHSPQVHSFKAEQPPLRFTSIARFWWNNLHFGGGRVIGYEQKKYMRLEMKGNQLLFPMDYLDCSASIHYWLKYYKYEALKTYFKKPKSKRMHPYPSFPFYIWPNLLVLFESKEHIKCNELSDAMIEKNVLKMEQYEKKLAEEYNNDSEKELKYLLNTLWGLKPDCDVMNHIRMDLKCDVIESFDEDWNQNTNCKYFIVRDSNVLRRIKGMIASRQTVDVKSLCDWNESMIDGALVLVKVTMCKKGVPKCGNPVFLNDALFGYIVHGGYSPIQGCGIGIAAVRLKKMLLSTSDDKVSVCPFWNHPDQLHSCVVELLAD